MARRSATKVLEEAPVEVVESEEETVETEENDAEVTDTGEDATVETSSVAESTEKAPEPVLDITPFLAKLDEALEKKDTTTGVMDEKSLSDLLAAYRDLDGAKNKSKARKHVQTEMRQAVNAGDLAAARALMNLGAVLSSGPSVRESDGSTRSPRVPVDPTALFVSNAVRLRLALQVHVENVNEKINEDWKDQVASKFDELKPQIATWKAYLDAEDENSAEPENVDLLVKAAFKTVAGRGTGVAKSPKAPSSGTSNAFDGPRRSVAKHLASAFADKELGTFLSIAQIRTHKSAEYGDEQPSPGAITARLFPTDANGTVKPTTVKGLEGAINSEGHKGAKLVGPLA